MTVRDCGFFDADECTGGHQFEGTEAVGSLCHCKDNNCNPAPGLLPGSVACVLAIQASLAFLR